MLKYSSQLQFFFSALKRNKSFSAGERPNLSKRMPISSLKTLPVIHPAESLDKLSPIDVPKSKVNLKRRGTFHTLDIAKKEGIMSRKQGVKTVAVEGKIFTWAFPCNVYFKFRY